MAAARPHIWDVGWRWLALGQGAYFAVTGVWPILDIGSFMAVTGPKTDQWLVKTVGAMITLVGVMLLYGGWKGPRGWHTLLLMTGIGFPLVLGGVDVIYATRGIISKIYLADALLEAAIVAAWIVLAPRAYRDRATGSPPG